MFSSRDITATSVREAFDRAAAAYDDVWNANPVVRRLRARLLRRMLRVWHAGDRIIELNCGTGEDAIVLARHGIAVLATDISQGMIDRATARIAEEGLGQLVALRTVDARALLTIGNETFSGALSNFGGLNCVENLRPIVEGVGALLSPGAQFITVFLGKHPIGANIAALRSGRLRSLMRRQASGTRAASVEGMQFPVHYWSVPELRALFTPEFTLTRVRSLSVVSPPPASRLARRFPKLTTALISVEEKIDHWWPVNRWGDHIVCEWRRV
jgi:ubiquinone/menaquinone biosynthesis C-methylase UbiE